MAVSRTQHQLTVTSLDSLDHLLIQVAAFLADVKLEVQVGDKTHLVVTSSNAFAGESMELQGVGLIGAMRRLHPTQQNPQLWSWIESTDQQILSILRQPGTCSSSADGAITPPRL